jgi:tetratricopeptide (TPR) repeat protein
MTEKMVTPFIGDAVGMGFFVEKHGNAVYFGHGGADEGFRAGLLVHKDKGYGVAVMVNSDNGDIINEIFRSVAKEYQWEDYLPQPREVITLDAGKLDEYTGRFQVNPDRVITVTKDAGRLYVEPTESPRVELYPLSETEFTRTDENVQYTYVRDESGKFNSVRIRFDGGALIASRAPAAARIPYELLMSGRIPEAIEAYRKIKAGMPGSVAVQEVRLNYIGYSLMAQNKLAEAIAILKLNVELYPKSSNVYDSLGEAYMRNGDKEPAIVNYKKSLELDPRNANAVEMLKKLQR